MSTLDEARAIIASLPQPEPKLDLEPELEPEDSAGLFGDPSEESVPEQPVSVPVVAKQPEQPRDSEAPVSRDDRRREAARMVLESGLTVRRAANETGLSPSSVHRAVEAAKRSGGIPERSGTTETPPPLIESDVELPPNFKTWGDLARSYKAAERKIREQGEELAELRAALAEAAMADPETLRRQWTQHRQALRHELERALALDGRLAAAEEVLGG